MTARKISVIIPAYNRAGLIGETLTSIFSQSVAPHEVIVVDDGSTDGTADVVSAFDPSIKLYRQQNRGAGAARNLGFEKTTGDLIHFMDSDDLASPNTYKTQSEALVRMNGDFAYGPWIKTRFSDRQVNFQKVVVQQRAVPASPEMYKWILRGWVTVFQPCLMTRQLIERVGPYRSDLKPSEDSELLFRIAKSGAKFVHTPETILLYRVHPDAQISTENTLAQREDWVRYLAVLDQHLASNGKLDLQTAITFDFRKLSATRGEGVDGIEETRQLSDSVSGMRQGLDTVTRPVRRVISRLRRMRFGGNYIRALGPAPMTRSQLDLVKQMGYEPA